MQNDIVGMEVVEINPLLDGSGETMLLANRVVKTSEFQYRNLTFTWFCPINRSVAN